MEVDRGRRITLKVNICNIMATRIAPFGSVRSEVHVLSPRFAFRWDKPTHPRNRMDKACDSPLPSLERPTEVAHSRKVPNGREQNLNFRLCEPQRGRRARAIRRLTGTSRSPPGSREGGWRGSASTTATEST